MKLKLAATLVSLVVTLQAHALEAGEPAPRFSLSGVNNEKVELGQFSNQLVYVDFWASWCVPCRQSFSWMNQMQKKYQAQGLRVVAINLDGKRADADKFLAEHPAEFTLAFDPDGKTPRVFGVKGMPTSYLVGRDGRVLFRHMGFNHNVQDELEQKIVAHLREGK